MNINDLKKQRDETFKVWSEQINGRISIESEEISGLKEKSARDGLYENSSYATLQKIANQVLHLLEKERFVYRQLQKTKRIDVTEKFSDFSDMRFSLEKTIDKTYKRIQENPNKSKEHFEELTKQVEKEVQKKEQEFFAVKETIAIYQKHTTLGRIVAVVLHEGRKPLAWYRNKIPNIQRYLKNAHTTGQLGDKSYDNLSEQMDKLSLEAQRLSSFFKRLDPLASNKRERRKKTNLNEILKNTIELFEEIAQEKNIMINLEAPEDFWINVIGEDIRMALTNIVENALFWVQYSNSSTKEINISIEGDQESIYIEIQDNGPGIAPEDLEDNIIFFPGYSRKNKVTDEGGTGLGLAIAGEAIHRNEGKLEVVESLNGACFRIILKRS